MNINPIDIVITTWGREWMMEACLDALKANTTTPHRLIIIDNGSTPEVQKLYSYVADVYVKMTENMGLEYAKNEAMKHIKSDYFISMDNDILVYKYTGKDWLQRLIELQEKYALSYAAIACKPQQLVGTSMAMFDTKSDIVEFPHVPGYARIMNTEVVKKTGAWSDKRPLRGHEEMWIGQKLSEAGWGMGWANNIECIHLWGREDEDMWGYKKHSDPRSHGHNPVWPHPSNDKEKIFEKTGIKI